MEPFLKWAGGKRWLGKRIKNAFPQYRRWIEPFLGSGALYFWQEPASAILSDVNSELINVYRAVRDHPERVSKALSRLHEQGATAAYYQIRSSRPSGHVSRAVRTLYLNRTCWNGLYRVNKKNEFNVPRGTKNAIVLDTDEFDRASQLLKRAEISDCDFEKTIDLAGEGDLLFCDPPYTVKHNFNGFIKYNENIFSWDDQVRLKEALKRAASRGVAVLVTNADHQSLHDLYDDGFSYVSIGRHSVLSGSPSGRSVTSEALFSVNIDLQILFAPKDAEQSGFATSAGNEILNREVGIF